MVIAIFDLHAGVLVAELAPVVEELHDALYHGDRTHGNVQQFAQRQARLGHRGTDAPDVTRM